MILVYPLWADLLLQSPPLVPVMLLLPLWDELLLQLPPITHVMLSAPVMALTPAMKLDSFSDLLSPRARLLLGAVFFAQVSLWTAAKIFRLLC